MKLNDLAKLSLLWSDGIDIDEIKEVYGPHFDLDKIWNDLGQWEQDDCRFLVEKFRDHFKKHGFELEEE